jgi:hypothetical protein
MILPSGATAATSQSGPRIETLLLFKLTNREPVILLTGSPMLGSTEDVAESQPFRSGCFEALDGFVSRPTLASLYQNVAI